MKRLYEVFLQLFDISAKGNGIVSQERGFFDLSSGEKIKILRAAGRNAQKEQQKLLKAYEARFGRAA